MGESYSKGVIPDNTDAHTQWVLRNFNEWVGNGCSLAPDDPVPKYLLASHDADLICKWLCQFLMEIRKTDGSLYSPSSLRSLIAMSFYKKIRLHFLLWINVTLDFVLC